MNCMVLGYKQYHTKLKSTYMYAVDILSTLSYLSILCVASPPSSHKSPFYNNLEVRKTNYDH